MENDSFSGSIPIFSRSHMAVDPTSSCILSDPLVQPNLPGQNSHRQMLNGNPFFSTVQEAAMADMYLPNNGVTPCSNISFSQNFPQTGDDYLYDGSMINGFHGHPLGTNLSANSFASQYYTSASPGNIIRVGAASTLELPSEEMRVSTSTDIHNSINASLPAVPHRNSEQKQTLISLASKYEAIGCKCSQNELTDHQVPSVKKSGVIPPSYHVMGSPQSSWNFHNLSWSFSSPYHPAPAPVSELSLSLAYCRPSVTDTVNVADQCSEVSCSAITQVTSAKSVHKPAEFHGDNHTVQDPVHHVLSGMTQSEAIHCTERFSLYPGSSSLLQLSHALLGSKYLQAVQQVLAEVVAHSLDDNNVGDDSFDGNCSMAKMSFSSSCSSVQELPTSFSDELLSPFQQTESEDNMDFSKCQEANRKKTELLSMLQLVDQSYSQWLNQIQKVITSFLCIIQSSTSDTHACFAPRSICALYKSLRRKITNQIFSIAQEGSTQGLKERERSFESSLLQKQWALKQLRKSEHQAWRPHRGLPENSVSVLRAWMFENFLHPYPNDSEKHLLAIKSGLTRSQVSNWFINARVRLWKPMIEEMYAELNQKKSDEGLELDGESLSNANSWFRIT